MSQHCVPDATHAQHASTPRLCATPAPERPCRRRAPAIRFTRHALLAAATALAGFSVAPQSWAQAVMAQPRQYDIPAGSLHEVLTRFGSVSGLLVQYEARLLEGRRSQGVRGSLLPEAALQVVLTGTGLQAMRQGNGAFALREVRTSSTVFSLPEVVVTGSGGWTAPTNSYLAETSGSAGKADLPIMETAQSVSVVTAEQIEDRKAISVEEAVAYTAGVRVGGAGLDPRFDQINIRGYAATANADFLDGLRQPNSGWLSYFTSEAYALERIEVLKGPASVLYGQISPGGLVNRVSKRPSEQAMREVQVQYGSNRHLQGQFDLGGRLDENGNLLYRVVGLARDAKTDIRQIDNDSLLLAPSLLWKLGERTQLTVLGSFQDRQTAGSARPWQQGTKLTDFWPGDEKFDKLDQRQWTLGYELEHAFNDTVSLQHNLRYGDVDTVNQYLSSIGVNGSVIDRASYGVYEDMRSLTTDTRLSLRFETGPARHHLLGGLDWARLEYDVTYATGTAPSIDRNRPDYHQYVPHPSNVLSDTSGRSRRTGVYVQDLIEIDRWRLSAALRRDWINTSSNNHLTGAPTRTEDAKTTVQAGMLYLFDAGFAPYASYAQSFLPNSGSNVRGEHYKPTAGEQIEVGLKYQPPGSNTMFTVSLYQLTQSNLLTRDPGDALNRIQTGEERSRGLELEAVSELSKALKLTASYSFNQAKITRNNDGRQGKAPTNTPRHLASVWLRYQVPEGELAGLRLAAGVRYVGPSYDDAQNTRKNGSYTVADLGLGYDFRGPLDRQLRLGLNFKNLADKRYIVCDGGFCYRGEGRAIIASLAYRW